MIVLVLGGAAAMGSGLELDRVDVLSSTSAAFLADDLPRLSFEPATTTLRFVGQVAPVFATNNLELSSSLSVQSVGLRAALLREVGLWVDGGLVARGLLPVGGRIGASLRRGPVRVGFGLCAEAAASWTNPRWTTWALRPALGIGFGRNLNKTAP